MRSGRRCRRAPLSSRPLRQPVDKPKSNEGTPLIAPTLAHWRAARKRRGRRGAAAEEGDGGDRAAPADGGVGGDRRPLRAESVPRGDPDHRRAVVARRRAGAELSRRARASGCVASNSAPTSTRMSSIAAAAGETIAAGERRGEDVAHRRAALELADDDVVAHGDEREVGDQADADAGRDEALDRDVVVGLKGDARLEAGGLAGALRGSAPSGQRPVVPRIHDSSARSLSRSRALRATRMARPAGRGTSGRRAA